MRRTVLFLAFGTVAGCSESSADAPADTETDTEAALGSTTDPTVANTRSSSGGETESSSTTLEPETDTEEPSTTTGPECSEDVPCSDAAAPFCVEGMCSTCEATETPDESCAMLDEAAPLCVGTSCEQCTAEEASACEGTTPLCDAEANTCVGCSFHEECQEMGLPACNIATGACFSNDAVTEVSLTSVSALQSAISGVADGAEHAVVITGGNGSPQAATVDGGKSIAIVSTDTSVQDISGNASSIVTVTGAGSTVFLHRVRLDGSNDVGISVASGATLYADATQVAGNSGGGIELAAGTSGFLRNCMVAGDGGDPGVSAVSADGAELSVLFSTLGLDFNNGGPTLECSGGSTVIRNSIVVSDSTVAGSALQCPGASIDNSTVENNSSADSWFGDIASGDYSLTAAGQTEFANVAIWEQGDPPFDFDGDARPNTDGAFDYAGADVP